MSTPHNDVVNQVPLFGMWVHPCFIFVLLLQDDISYGQVVLRTEGEDPLAKHPLPYTTVLPNLNVEVPKEEDL